MTRSFDVRACCTAAIWGVVLLMGFGTAAPNGIAAVSYELGSAEPFCKEFRLGKWNFEDLRGPEADDVLYFRWKNAEKSALLVRSTRFGMLDHASREIYALNLSARQVQRATDDEWSEGLEAETFGCGMNGAYCGTEWIYTQIDEPLVIDGLKMPMAGQYWPSTADTSAVPSPRKTWILLQSYSGKVQNSVERWGTEFGHLIRGTAYIQLVRMKDAKELFQIRFQIRGEWPSSFASAKPWLEEDLLVLDVFPNRRRLLICRID